MARSRKSARVLFLGSRSSQSWHSGNFSPRTPRSSPRTTPSSFLHPTPIPNFLASRLYLIHNGMFAFQFTIYDGLKLYFELESLWNQFPRQSRHPSSPSSIQPANTLSPSAHYTDSGLIVCPPQHQEPCSPPGPRPSPAHQARGQDRLWHLPPREQRQGAERGQGPRCWPWPPDQGWQPHPHGCQRR